jgi:hypothetical protein
MITENNGGKQTYKKFGPFSALSEQNGLKCGRIFVQQLYFYSAFRQLYFLFGPWLCGQLAALYGAEAVSPGYPSMYFLLDGEGRRAIDNFRQQLFRNWFRLCLSQNNLPDAGYNVALLHFTILHCFLYENFNETIFVTVYRASLLPVKNDTTDLTTEN